MQMVASSLAPLLRKSLFSLALLLFGGGAMAQPVCGPREALLRQIATEYREFPAAVGLAGNGTLFELLLSAEGTWTLIATRPNGISCFVGGGDSWQPVARKPEEGGA
jgi:hypothetical protein